MIFFESAAREIFGSAGITKEQAPELFEECVKILGEKMAFLSAAHGMSYERIEAYEKQKNSLAQDLKDLKARGELR